MIEPTDVTLTVLTSVLVAHKEATNCIVGLCWTHSQTDSHPSARSGRVIPSKLRRHTLAYSWHIPAIFSEV